MFALYRAGIWGPISGATRTKLKTYFESSHSLNSMNQIQRQKFKMESSAKLSILDACRDLGHATEISFQIISEVVESLA